MLSAKCHCEEKRSFDAAIQKELGVDFSPPNQIAHAFIKIFTPSAFHPNKKEG